jgi:hypothetical protein
VIKELQEKIKKRAVRCEGEEELWSAIDDIVSETALAVCDEIQAKLYNRADYIILEKLRQEIKDNV